MNKMSAYESRILEDDNDESVVKVSGKLHSHGEPARIKYRANGMIKRKEWYTAGVLHNPDGPAVTKYYKSGKKKEELYLICGVLHRTDGPAYIRYCDGIKVKEVWFYVSKIHNPSGPAWVEYNKEDYYLNDVLQQSAILKVQNEKAIRTEFPDGSILEEWYYDGKLHRDSGPAQVLISNEGRVEYEKWYFNGKVHRDHGCAYDSPDVKVYYFNGKYHRTKLPAVTVSNEGVKEQDFWYFRGHLENFEYPTACSYKDGILTLEEWPTGRNDVLSSDNKGVLRLNHLDKILEHSKIIYDKGAMVKSVRIDKGSEIIEYGIY